MNPLLIVGSVAIDTIRTPQGTASDQLGGSATFAGLVARHWVEPVLLSAIGGDFPEALLRRMEAASLNLSDLTREENAKSFRWEGLYDEGLGLRETTGLELGVMATAKLRTPDLSSIRFCMMGNYHPARELEVLEKLPEGCFIGTDTIEAWIKFEREALTGLFRRSSLICIDTDELAKFTEEPDELVGVEKLFELGARWAVIKYGAHGSSLYGSQGERFRCGAYKTQARDTTGAGDTFLATILAHLAATGRADFETLQEGMKLGAAAASITVEAFGVDSLIKANKEDIERRATLLES